MSFGKEATPNMLPTNPRPDHLVCTDAMCPTTADPYTGRILCRCYQLAESREPTLSSLHPSPGQPSYHGLYAPQYTMEPTSPMQASTLQASAMASAAGGRWDPSMFAGNGFPSPYAGHAQPGSMPKMAENIIRSQMYNYMYPILDINSARRKNATRETTSALKAWLKEHKKNPYPTKAEKIMLAIVTKMTLTQVSTWFANARRRLKKETKDGDISPENSMDNSNISSEDDDHTPESTDQELTKETFDNRLSQGMQSNILTSTPIPSLPGISSFSKFPNEEPSSALANPHMPLTVSPTSGLSNVLHANRYIAEHDQSGHLLNPLATANFTPGLNMCNYKQVDQSYFSRNYESKSMTDSEDSDKENSESSKTDTSSEDIASMSSQIPKRKIWSISEIIGSHTQVQDIDSTVPHFPSEDTLSL